jgi:hypothetical protein
MTAGRIARRLWWVNQEVSPVNVILPWFSVGGRSSETYSYPIDMMMMMIIIIIELSS